MSCEKIYSRTFTSNKSTNSPQHAKLGAFIRMSHDGTTAPRASNQFVRSCDGAIKRGRRETKDFYEPARARRRVETQQDLVDLKPSAPPKNLELALRPLSRRTRILSVFRSTIGGNVRGAS
jgi:hypothetical protein